MLHKVGNDNNKEKQGQKTWKEKFAFVFGIVAKSVFDLGLVALVAFFTIFLYVYYTTVQPDALVQRTISETSIIYDSTGEHELYRMYGEENRKVIAHDDIPDFMRSATIAAEDDNFYHHMGVDVFGIVRALEKNFIAGSKAQGGSTITQQLVRNTFLSREKTIKRKFIEIVLAIKMERHYSKAEILDFYLNEVPYGSNAYGVQAAAQNFFGKNARDLTLDEAALLASLPKATTYYSPYGNNIDALKERQQSIIARLGELRLYDQAAIDEALKADTLAKLQEFHEEIDAPHFVFYVREQLEQMYGTDVVQRGGLKVYTTLNYDMQKRAEEDVSKYASKLPQYNASNAALVALSPKTGDVLAMVGSVDYFDKKNDGEVNVALRPRQPGSSFKPIVYAAGFDKGYQPETLLYDVQTSFGKDGSGKDYTPHNYDGQNHGLVPVRKALAGSLNVPAVKMLYLVGIDNAIDFAETLGITTLTDRKRYGLSLVLGGGEVKLLEETGAFAVFGNDGVRAPVHGINRVIDASGKEISSAPQSERVIDAEVARKISSILSDNDARSFIFGSSSAVYIPGKKVAAKTGTTQDYRDAWTVGYTPEIAVGVWVGNNDGTLMRAGSDGSFVAAPLWHTFMARELESLPDTQFEPYQKIESHIPMITGNRPDGVSEDGGKIYFNKNTGKQISAEKASKMDKSKLEEKYAQSYGGHSILYYVNKDNPLDETAKPNYSDPMLALWDAALNGSNKDDNKD
ncbi:MAG: PBP1A family penicillin-binding protein [Parcubacteria group bacterium]|jgi:1A family penicillin-binding protein